MSATHHKPMIYKRVNTEKSNRVGDSANQYVFFVSVFSNKTEIKKLIEELYNVTVEAVMTSTLKPTKTRSGGYSKKTKKAYVRLKKGDDIMAGKPQEKKAGK